MNERIKELYEQAHERKPVMVVDPQTGNVIQAGWINKPMYHNEFNPEKFAELIIQECIDQCADIPDSRDEYDKGIRWAANQIKAHFGVE